VCSKCDDRERSVCIIHFFYRNLVKDNFYIKIVAIYGIYNFVIEKFLFETVLELVSKYCLSLSLQKNPTLPRAEIFAESRGKGARQRRTFAEGQVRRSAKASFAKSRALGKGELSAKSLDV